MQCPCGKTSVAAGMGGVAVSEVWGQDPDLVAVAAWLRGGSRGSCDGLSCRRRQGCTWRLHVGQAAKRASAGSIECQIAAYGAHRQQQQAGI